MTDEPGAGREPTEEELRAALEEQMKRITVKDVLLQTVITLVNLSARKLGLAGEEGGEDLGEAHKAIEGIRALLPLLPDEEQAAVREPLSQLQMRYAQEARSQGAERSGQQGPQAAGEGPQAEPEAEPGDPDAEARAKARAKIWTPPGT
jgi:hypothetical protein